MNRFERISTVCIQSLLILSISLIGQDPNSLTSKQLSLEYYEEGYKILQSVYENNSPYADAIPLFEKSAFYARKDKDYNSELYALDHIAYIYLVLNDYGSASRVLGECYAKYAAIENNNDQYLLADLNFIKSYLLFRSGENDQSLYYVSLLDKYLKRGGKFSYKSENVYRNLAFNYQEIGDYHKAIEVFQYVVDTNPKITIFEHATYLSNIAGCYIELGESEKANEFLLKSESLLFKNEDAITLDFYKSAFFEEKARFLIKSEKYELAKRNLLQQEKLKNRTLEDINRLILYGDMLVQQDSFVSAAKFYEEAISLCESELNHNVYKQAQIFVKSGENALNFDNDYAIAQLDNCVDLLTHSQNLESVDLDSITSHRILIEGLFNLSTAHIVRNDLVKSEYYALQAFRIAKYLLEYSFVNPESKFYYVFYYRQHVSKILDLLIENNATETAYKLMAESKSLLFRIEYDQINNNQQPLESLSAGFSNEKEVVDVNLVKKLLKRNKKNKSNLIDYFVYKDKLYIFHFSKNQLQVITKKIEQKHRDQIVSLYTDMSDVNTNSFDSILFHSNQLYELLLKDVLANSKRHAKNLVIIPDEELHYVPFEVLAKQNEKEIAQNRYDQINYLINDYDVSYHYSSLLMTDDRELSQEYIGFAPFNKKSTSKDNFSFLPNSEEEIDYANQLFEGTVFNESSADTTQLFHALHQGGILHIATHTSEDSLVKNLNRLVLSDGMIGSERIDSIACDLAVLSACKTAHGELKKGEGLISISRTFLSRGAKSVLTSLWNVNDKSALTISSLFFDRLHQGNNIGNSLSSSKRKYLETINSPIQAHPYYWAGFVNIGNHQLKIQKGFDPLLMILFLSISILIYFYWKKVSSN